MSAVVAAGYSRLTVPSAQLRYWPCELLHAFTLQMAAHGCCVNASMMLGDHTYATEQLEAAQRCGDAALQELAQNMLNYFSSPAITSAGGAASVAAARALI